MLKDWAFSGGKARVPPTGRAGLRAYSDKMALSRSGQGMAAFDESFGRAAAASFLHRAHNYSVFDRRLSCHTRFFGAAALTNQVLAEIVSHPLAKTWLSASTVHCLRDLGGSLMSVNENAAATLMRVERPARGWDAAMVSMEQSLVQTYLSRLESQEPRTYLAIVKQMDGLFSAARFASMERLASVYAALRCHSFRYAAALRTVSSRLKRPICFSIQGHRELIGNTLIAGLRRQAGQRGPLRP